MAVYGSRWQIMCWAGRLRSVIPKPGSPGTRRQKMLVFLKPFSCRLPCTREVWDSSVLGVLPLRFDGADDAHECVLPAHSGTFLCHL